MATKEIPQEIRTKISKLIPKLASDQYGELLATVSAIRRTLERSKLDLHDLAAAIETTAAPIIVDTGKPDTRAQPAGPPRPPRPPRPQRPEKDKPHKKFSTIEPAP